MSKLLAVGTVAFDAIETPFGKTDKILGGSGTFVGRYLNQNSIGVDISKSQIDYAQKKYDKNLLLKKKMKAQKYF